MSIPPHDQAGRQQTGRALLLMLAPACLLIALLFGGGLTLGLMQATGFPWASGRGPSLEHFVKVLGDPDFGSSLLLTLHLAFTSTLIAAVISIALALTLMGAAGRSRTIHFLLQIPLTAPHLVIAIAILFLLAPSGVVSRVLITVGMLDSATSFPLLVNDRWLTGAIVVYVWKEVPFITFMLLAVLKNFGPELLEVGATLKASPWQRFRHILLPAIAPNLGAACLIVFAFTFGAFEVPYLLGQTYPMTLPVWAYRSYSDVDLVARPEGIALGIIIALLICLLVVFSQLLLGFGKRLRGEL